MERVPAKKAHETPLDMKPPANETRIPLVLLFTVAGLVAGCSSKQAMIIPDGSMTPTLQKGETVTANFLAYRIEDPRIGDLAIFLPQPPHYANWVFRVAAVPGDRLSYENGSLQRNSETLIASAPFNGRVFPAPPNATVHTKVSFPYTLKADEYFFLSDDPDCRSDSRFLGPTHRSEIVGKLANR